MHVSHPEYHWAAATLCSRNIDYLPSRLRASQPRIPITIGQTLLPTLIYRESTTLMPLSSHGQRLFRIYRPWLSHSNRRARGTFTDRNCRSDDPAPVTPSVNRTDNIDTVIQTGSCSCAPPATSGGFVVEISWRSNSVAHHCHNENLRSFHHGSSPDTPGAPLFGQLCCRHSICATTLFTCRVGDATGRLPS